MSTAKQLMLALSLGVMMARIAGAQAPPKVSVWVRHTGDDAVGVMLASDVKEAIARSARLEIGSDQSIAGVSLVSVDIGNEGNHSAVSAQYSAWLLCKSSAGKFVLADGKYDAEERVTHAVYVVGRQKTETQAKAIVAEFGEWRDGLKCR